MQIARQASPHTALSNRSHAAALLFGVVVVVAAIFGTALLWVRYGTAVFFEMIAAGIAACF